MERSIKKAFDTDKYLKKKDSFGTIVFESDEDMQPLIAYRSYSDRWLLELVFNRYKNDECLDHTNVQNDLLRVHQFHCYDSDLQDSEQG